MKLRVHHLIVLAVAFLALVGPAAAQATSGGSGAGGGSSSASGRSGGAAMQPGPVQSTPSQPQVQGYKAKIVNGLAYAPSDAPIQIKRLIWAGNKIRHKPYCYGGGHGSWNDSCYDCSGTVSYVLHAAGLLNTSMDSTEFESWGKGGAGRWITVYTNPDHAFIEVAGIRLDTSAYQDPNPAPGSGPRWRPLVTDSSGFESRHPDAF